MLTEVGKLRLNHLKSLIARLLRAFNMVMSAVKLKDSTQYIYTYIYMLGCIFFPKTFSISSKLKMWLYRFLTALKALLLPPIIYFNTQLKNGHQCELPSPR